MISRSVYKPVLAALLLVAGLCSNPLPALAAPTPTQLVEAIATSKVLPASVRVNAQYYMGQVSVYMYRSGRVPDNDLKIDSVLVTKVLRDKFGTDVKSVQLNFYDSNNQRDVRQCVVSQAQVDDFAARKMSQEQLLNYLTITRTTVGGGYGGAGGSYSNAAKEQVLAAVCSPGFREEDRGILLLQIKSVAKKDGNYQKLFAKFKQMDDMVRAGKTEEIIPIYNELNPMVSIEQANCNQRAAAQNADAATKYNQAIVQNALMSYFPHTGFAYRRRVAIWTTIKRMNQGGQDVSAYVEYLQKRVDKPFLAGDFEGMKAGIIQLEQQLGIPVTFIWN